MASGGGGCSASERLPPPFPGLEPESEGAAGGSEPEAGDSDTEGEDIFTGAAAASKPQSPKRITSFPVGGGSTENRIHEEQDQEPQDLFADATVELSLDSTQNNRKKAPAKTLASLPPQEGTNSKPQQSYEELEEEEQEDQFDLTVGITDPEKIGDGMNAYVAYKVTTQFLCQHLPSSLLKMEQASIPLIVSSEPFHFSSRELTFSVRLCCEA